VERCLVGYAGGEESSPVSYQEIKDYTEALLIEYDSNYVSYRDILQAWKNMAAPYPSKRQYRTAIFPLNAEQKEVALDFLKSSTWSERLVSYVDVEIVDKFYLGEEYHQDFLAKQTSMMRI
jgi:peptide methionine sulfoxide reductase MsrA